MIALQSVLQLDRAQARHLHVSEEPISKSSGEDNKAGELDKAEEVLSMIFPTDEDATLSFYPGEEALDLCGQIAKGRKRVARVFALFIAVLFVMGFHSP